jgi:hypothetical protein
VVQATELAVSVSFAVFHVLAKVVERTSCDVLAVVARATQRRSWHVSEVRVVHVLGVVSVLQVEPPSFDTKSENTCASVMSPSRQVLVDPQEKVVIASPFAKWSAEGDDQVVPAFELRLNRGTPPGPVSMSAQVEALQVSVLTPIPWAGGVSGVNELP